MRRHDSRSRSDHGARRVRLRAGHAGPRGHRLQARPVMSATRTSVRLAQTAELSRPMQEHPILPDTVTSAPHCDVARQCCLPHRPRHPEGFVGGLRATKRTIRVVKGIHHWRLAVGRVSVECNGGSRRMKG